MIVAKCNKRFRDKNAKIIEYGLLDQNGQTLVLSSNSLKQLMKVGHIKVLNLKLTSDDRIVESATNGKYISNIKDETVAAKETKTTKRSRKKKQ